MDANTQVYTQTHRIHFCKHTKKTTSAEAKCCYIQLTATGNSQT